ncbi:MAG: hypothetical protein KFB93_00745 [Simkaniaceae bacterium]|nr:MAG: hypothetical protein KFB93_00745 [Simkaniaceae bacterium]
MSKEENFILFSDVKQLFIRSIGVIALGSLLFGGIGFWARTQVPVKYEVCATFKDAAKTSISQAGVFETLLKSMNIGGGERQGSVLITSSIILEPVIEKLGLQASVQGNSKWGKKRDLFIDALRAEKGLPLKEKGIFEFENVRYLGRLPKTCILYFFTLDLFEIRDQKDQVLLKGEVGKEAAFDGVTFTLKTIPENLKLRTSYPLSIHPLQEQVISLRDQIDVDQNTMSQGVLELTLFHSNPIFAKGVLNAIMEEYQSYLVSENQRISEGQIAYLEKKRDEFCTKMNEHLQTHVVYLKNNLKESGSLSLGHQLPIFQDRKEKFSKDLMALKLKKGKLEKGETFDLGQEVRSLQASLHEMTKERDELSLAFLGASTHQKNIATHLHKLEEIERKKLRTQTGIDIFFTKLFEPVREQGRLFLNTYDFGTVFLPETLELKKVEEEKKELIALAGKNHYPKLSKEYLDNNIRLLSLQEEVIKKRLLSGATKGEEYRGIDINTARKLLLDYLHKRDDLLFKFRQMEFGKKQLEKEDIEYISLGETFPDSTSQGLVRELGEMTQQLRKKRTLTEKEIERLERKFSSKKDDLIHHMKETMALTLLEKERVEERIHSVQVAILDLLGQEIALIEKQVEDRIDEQLKFLDQEMQLIHDELDLVKKEMEGVPDSWLRERELAFTADMNQGMLEALVQLVESKSIESNLSMIESKPINYPYASFVPKSPLLKVFGLIGAFIGGLIAFIGCFARALYKGFPIGLRNMASRGRNVIGTLTNNPSKDLEVLRNLSLLVNQQKRLPLIVTLIIRSEEDYSVSFADLLAKEGKQLLMIDLDFSKKIKQKNLPGLIHYLEGEAKEPSLRKKSFGDYLPMGGKSPYAQELLKGAKFGEYLEKMKKSYDIILLAVSAEAKSSLPKHFFPQSDVMTLRLKGESYDQLIPYLNWEDEGKALAFLA